MASHRRSRSPSAAACCGLHGESGPPLVSCNGSNGQRADASVRKVPICWLQLLRPRRPTRSGRPRKLRNSPQLIRAASIADLSQPPVAPIVARISAERARGFPPGSKMLTACFQVARLLCPLATFFAPASGAHIRGSVDCALLALRCPSPTRAKPGHHSPAQAVSTGFRVRKCGAGRLLPRIPIHPRTLIPHLVRAVLQVFDLTKLGGPPGGQSRRRASQRIAPSLARSTGIGVTLRKPTTASKTPNIYVGATSLFGQASTARQVRL